jgi:hypothetical protein
MCTRTSRSLRRTSCPGSSRAPTSSTGRLSPRIPPYRLRSRRGSIRASAGFLGPILAARDERLVFFPKKLAMLTGERVVNIGVVLVCNQLHILAVCHETDVDVHDSHERRPLRVLQCMRCIELTAQPAERAVRPAFRGCTLWPRCDAIRVGLYLTCSPGQLLVVDG